MIGKKYNRLTVLKDVEKIWKYKYCECLCDCWNIKYIQVDRLRYWNTKSCGCLRIETIVKASTKHSMSYTRIYGVWVSLQNRCKNKGNLYKNYSWRWIKCEWNSFQEFYADMWKEYEEHVKEYGEKDTTIERINNDWNYCKANCRWATRHEQRYNKRNTWLHKWNPVKMICKEKNINYHTVHHRFYVLWWDIERTLSTKTKRWF